MNPVKKTQSPALHFSMLKLPFPLLRSDWMIRHIRHVMLMAYFFHCPWLASCFTIVLTFWISRSFCASPVGSFGRPSVSTSSETVDSAFFCGVYKSTLSYFLFYFLTSELTETLILSMSNSESAFMEDIPPSLSTPAD